MPDFGSILLAAALSGICLTMTLSSIWFSSRRANYVLIMGVGIFVLVLHIVAFWQYGRNPSPALAQATLLLLILGFLVVKRGAREYLDLPQTRSTLVGSLISTALVSTVAAFGYDGIGFIIAYATVSVLLAMTGRSFFREGGQDHKILLAVSLLTVSGAISFALCGAVLLWNQQWSLGRAPDNWAENINSVLAVIFMTALGALTISMHHLRAKKLLVADSMTDPLTELMNRRALHDLYGQKQPGEEIAVALFDLDNFKKTNDVFGHPVGDMVLRRFADILRRQQRDNIEAFRLGGEEFAVVMKRTDLAEAMALAERIAVSFGSEVVPTPLGPLRSSVSGGVAMGDAGSSITDTITRADVALYEAKRAGRNRIACEFDPPARQAPPEAHALSA